MKHDNLEVAQRRLQAAQDALNAELQVVDSYALWDAVSLITDAQSQIRGEIKSRLPERPIYVRRAS